MQVHLALAKTKQLFLGVITYSYLRVMKEAHVRTEHEKQCAHLSHETITHEV